MCIFSRHNIISDPAFMRLDLISCRNMLIYFTTELQDRIFPMFHYALNDTGILFLGKSESIGRYNYQFKFLDKNGKYIKLYFMGKKHLHSLSNFQVKEKKLDINIKKWKQLFSLQYLI